MSKAKPEHDSIHIRDKQATRQRILEAAERVFAEKGYHGTVVDDIIHTADISKGGFYFHFPNKQGIFLVLMEALTPRLISATERAIGQETDPIAKVDAALRTVLATFARHRRLSRILLIEAVGLGPNFEQKLMQVRTQFAAVIQRHLDQAIAEGAIAPLDTEVASFAWLGAINELVSRWLVAGKPEELEDILPELRVLLLRSAGVRV
ncbi:MAG: TetR/AcrR family transcriptional regulator [Ktedonobacteraceae bacterium]